MDSVSNVRYSISRSIVADVTSCIRAEGCSTDTFGNCLEENKIDVCY